MSIWDTLLPQEPPAPKDARHVFGSAGPGNIIGDISKNMRNLKYWRRNKERLNAKRRASV